MLPWHTAELYRRTSASFSFLLPLEECFKCFFKKATQTLKMHALLLFLFLVLELFPQKTDKNHKIK